MIIEIISFLLILLIIYIIEKRASKSLYNQLIENKKILNELQEEYDDNIISLNNLKEEKQNIEFEIKGLKNLQDNISNNIESSNEISKKAYENYSLILQNEYEKTEEEYNSYIQNLEECYQNRQTEILEELKKFQSTREALAAANIREEIIQEDTLFYCLQISEEDIRESKIIKNIEDLLRDPRPVRMLIWSTYYLKRANELCSRVLGKDNVTGIYKITNTKNKLSYIGQSLNVKERWREHMKCGLGIDTPAGNKLYNDMMKYGLENFTFELLEQCDSKDLNEKEKTYIEIYNTYNFGYNQNKGIGKGMI